MARVPWSDRSRLLGERASSFLLQSGVLPARRAAPPDRTLVLFYNTMFGAPLDRPPEGLPDGFELSTDLRRFHEARAVVFHIPSLGRIERLRKREGQLWVAWWMESDDHFPRLADPEFIARFDLTMSHRRSADVCVSYLAYFDEKRLRAEPRPKPETAALFMSGAAETSGRTAYAEELMRHIEVNSYGRLLHNRDLADDRGDVTKLETIARYKFTLAFENAIAADYVTEKLYDPLAVGSVPVYLGAPNVGQLAPSRDCYIDVRDFADPEALAARLSELDGNKAAYERHLAWKRRPFAAEFQQLLEEQGTDAVVRLCDLIGRLGPRG